MATLSRRDKLPVKPRATFSSCAEVTAETDVTVAQTSHMLKLIRNVGETSVTGQMEVQGSKINTV